MSWAYYNEIEPFAAQWLRNLIAKNLIAPGVVDERSIEDVCPKEIREFTQCHFFAGIGVWSYALRSAGWEDSRPVWTGSCPCQPFSTAGKSNGFADDRHLWPAWFYLIGQCKPRTIFGEQVASKDGLAWLDLVQSDLEGTNYTNAALDICAAGFGAPHIRQRLWFVAEKELANSFSLGFEGECRKGEEGIAQHSEVSALADSQSKRWERCANSSWKAGRVSPEYRCPVNGYWKESDWLECQDGKARPVEPGTFPLAYGTAGRVGRLRAYGNAINPEVARQFIEAYMESF